MEKPSDSPVWTVAKTPQGLTYAGSDALHVRLGDGRWSNLQGVDAAAFRALLPVGEDIWVGHSGGLAVIESSGVVTVTDISKSEVWQIGASGDNIVAVTRDEMLLVDPRLRVVVASTKVRSVARLLLHQVGDTVVIVQGKEGRWSVEGRAFRFAPHAEPLLWCGIDGAYMDSRTIVWRGKSVRHSLGRKVVIGATEWDGALYIATYQDGLFRLDPDAEELEPAELPDQNPTITSISVVGEHMVVGTMKRLFWLSLPSEIANLATAEPPSTFIPDASPVLLYPSKTATERGSGPKTWSWARLANGEFALGSWGSITAKGETAIIGNSPVRSITEHNGELFAASAKSVFKIVGKTAHEIFTHTKDVASIATDGAALIFSDFHGDVFRWRFTGESPAEIIRSTPGERNVSVVQQKSGFLILAPSVVSGPIPVAGLPASFPKPLVFAEDTLWLLLRDGAFNRVYHSVDGIKWFPVEMPFIQEIGEPMGVTSDESFIYLSGDKGTMRWSRKSLRMADIPDRPSTTVLFDGVPPERKSPFVSIQKVEIRPAAVPPRFGFEPTHLRYRMGKSDPWTTVKAGTPITLNLLRSGSYSVEMQHQRSGRESATHTATFVIPQPWYFRGPSIAVYAILVPMLGFAGYSVRARRLLKRNEELESLVRLRTVELEKANAAKSEFLAMMSHEIRNPMNGVIGLVRILESQGAGVKQRHTVNLLSRCADQLCSTVDDVLDFAKIEAGEIAINPSEFVVEEIITQSVSVTNGRDSFRLEDGPQNRSRVRADATKIRQVIVNYLTNALKYGRPPGGTIACILQEEAGKTRLTVSVRSLGATITKDKLDTFFESFTRGEDAQRQNIRGVGLGLAICKRYAEAMGGSVGAVSASGETTFYLSVPVELLAQGGAIAAAPKPTVTPMAARALAIEDEDYNRVVLASILSQLNYTVDWAACGRDAIELAKVNGYDIILTDYRLPDMNGVELAQQLMTLCPEPKPATFAITAYSTKEKRAECMAAGMAGFIPKPISLEKLQAALQNWAANRPPSKILERNSVPRGVHPEVAQAWKSLRQSPTVYAVHCLNNLCRHVGLSDVGDELALLELALEEGRDLSVQFLAVENLLIAHGVLSA